MDNINEVNKHKTINNLFSSIGASENNSSDLESNLLSTSNSSSTNMDTSSTSVNSYKRFSLGLDIDNMNVIKEFRNAFLEKYLEKNKLGRKSKLTNQLKSTSSRRNSIRRLSSMEKEIINENAEENDTTGAMRIRYAISNVQKEFEQFQNELFKSQDGSLNENKDFISKEYRSHSISCDFNEKNLAYEKQYRKNENQTSNSFSEYYTSYNTDNMSPTVTAKINHFGELSENGNKTISIINHNSESSFDGNGTIDYVRNSVNIENSSSFKFEKCATSPILYNSNGIVDGFDYKMFFKQNIPRKRNIIYETFTENSHLMDNDDNKIFTFEIESKKSFLMSN